MRGPFIRVHQHPLPYVTWADETDWRGRADIASLPAALPVHARRATKLGSPAVSFLTRGPGARRGKAGVTGVTALALDVDHISTLAARSIAVALRERGLAHVLYSSFSHRERGPEDNCFRVVVPLAEPLLPGDQPAAWAALNHELGGHADLRARDLARIWFLPACPEARLPLAVYQARDGHLLDGRALLAAHPGLTEPNPEPLPRRPLAPLTLPADHALRVARYRLNHEVEARERVAVYLDARCQGNRATGIRCPACGRPSVWFWLDPARRHTASCNHRKSCGWWGFLDVLVGEAGASHG
jgi:hypothetical protein